ncbi:MAG: hypothetical protein ACM3NH_00355 [Candidatus Saccharibacteria bacterium]
MHEGLESVLRRTKEKRKERIAAIAARISAEIAGYPNGINVYALPVSVPSGCVLASTLELGYYPAERSGNSGHAGVRHGYYKHVRVGRYSLGEGELDLVLIIPVFAEISDEDAEIYANLIREKLGISEPDLN